MLSSTPVIVSGDRQLGVRLYWPKNNCNNSSKWVFMITMDMWKHFGTLENINFNVLGVCLRAKDPPKFVILPCEQWKEGSPALFG